MPAQPPAFDGLTGLLTRNAFVGQVARRLAHDPHRPYALFMLDIRHFSHVNRAFGRAGGDNVLRTISERLALEVDSSDVLARAGGDRFVLLTDGRQSDAQLVTLFERLRAAVMAPLGARHGRLMLHLDSGIARSADGVTAEQLIGRGELALDEVAGGGSRALATDLPPIFFASPMEIAARRRREMLVGLHDAVRLGELFLRFQPQVTPDGSTVTGYEALVRWQHPRLGALAPGSFIPLAEQHGVITELSDWVMRHACADALRLPPHADIAINVSAREFDSGDLPRRISTALTISGLDPKRLTIEITESSMLDHGDRVVAQIDAIRNLSVRVSIDDFGAGYTSLHQLLRFPVDEVKLDRKLVVGIEQTHADLLRLLESAAAMAHKHQIAIVAEGVETQDQLAAVSRFKVDAIQGYYFSTPIALQQAAEFVPRPGTASEARAPDP